MSASRLEEPVRQLVPFTGIQFLDLSIDTGILPMLSAFFTEERFDTEVGQRRVLLPISTDQSPDGTVFHPVTFRPLGPADTLSYSGLEAVEPFLDCWTPLPFLRYLGQDQVDAGRFDLGPTNWARIHIERPPMGLRGADRLRAVLAFDTRLERTERVEGRYLSPNIDDAMFGSTFRLVDNPELLSGYLSQTWIDAWLKSIADRPRAAEASPNEPLAEDAPGASPDRFTLSHLARYLAFLKVLPRAAPTPSVRFIDSVSPSRPIPIVGLDLILDLDASETVVVLAPREGVLEPGTVGSRSFGLRMRDLNAPATVHHGPIPTLVEFDNVAFGSAQLSRHSGRSNAFAWPSLVRVGWEARRLGLRANAICGTTGSGDFHHRMGDTAPSAGVWRFSTPDGIAARRGPMVSGEVMRHLSEGGESIERPQLLLTSGRPDPSSSGSAVPAVRPRFSQSALVSFFLAEVLLHAVSEINSADPQSPFGADSLERNDVRRIDRIILTSPLALPAEDRQIVIERVHNAIDLVWRNLQADDANLQMRPQRPSVALSMGTDVGAQLVHLYDEVRTKFGGSFSELVDCVRRRTGEPDARDNLRVASLDVGYRAIGLTIIDFDVVDESTVEVDVVLADRAERGSERIVDALCASVVLPAIEAALAAAGIVEPRAFLGKLTEADVGSPSRSSSQDASHAGRGGASDIGQLAERVESKIVRPAALQLFRHYAALPPRSGLGVERARLDDLAIAGGGRLDPAAGELNAHAAAEGATRFDLAAVSIDSSRRHFEALLATELWPAIGAACDAIRDTGCDLLLLTGEHGGLADLSDEVLANSPVEPGRIAVVTQPRTAFAPMPDVRASAIVGAYLAGRNQLTSDGLTLATRKAAEALASGNIPSRQSLARGTERLAIAPPLAREQLG